MPVTDWNRGDVITAAHLQENVDETNRLGSIVGAGVGNVRQHEPPYRYQRRIGTITDHGPSGESDYTDERYWVQPNFIEAGADQDDNITLDDESPLYPEDEGLSTIITVTNLREIGGSTASLSVGDVVEFFAVADGDDPAAIHFVMSEAGISLIPVALSSDGGANGDATTAPTYTYTVTRVTGGSSIATTASPLVARPKGKVTAASYGLGYYTGGSFSLLIAFEVPGSGSCP